MLFLFTALAITGVMSAAVDSAQLCWTSVEYSAKLNLDMMTNRREGMKVLQRELDKLDKEEKWFERKRGTSKPAFQIVDFLDDSNGTFAQHGLAIRLRTGVDGAGKGKTDIVVKRDSLARSDLPANVVESSRQWRRNWHCKVEANVYSNGDVIWQMSSKAKAHVRNFELARAFHDHHSFATATDLSSIYPGLPKQVYPNSSEEAVALKSTKREYRWLEHVYIKLHGAKTIRADITLQYSSNEDMNSGKVRPINADFEWKLIEGTTSWREQKNSAALMRELLKTSIINASFANVALSEVLESEALESRPTLSRSSVALVLVAMAFSAAATIVVVLYHQRRGIGPLMNANSDDADIYVRVEA